MAGSGSFLHPVVRRRFSFQVGEPLMSIIALSEMTHGQEADLFVLMTVKEELTTRDGKPYFKVGFRDMPAR